MNFIQLQSNNQFYRIIDDETAINILTDEPIYYPGSVYEIIEFSEMVDKVSDYVLKQIYKYEH